MKNKIEVNHLGITVKISHQSATRFVIADYSSGKRVRHVRTTRAEAVAQAKNVCTAYANGKKEERAMIVDDDLKADIVRAKDILKPTELRLSKAAQVVYDACQIVRVDQIVEACRWWRDNGPDKKIVPKLVDDAVTEFLAVQEKKLSASWYRSMASYVGAFKKGFMGRKLSEITTGDIQALIEQKAWSAKSHNLFCDSVSLLFKYASSGNRNWVGDDYNPLKKVERRTLKGTDIGIFAPWEAKQMLERLEEDYSELIPFLTLWLFSGCRKEEVSRLSWQQVQAGMKTGNIEVLASQAKTGQARSVPLLPNARAWLTWWEAKNSKQETGMVLPLFYRSMSGLSQLTQIIPKATGVAWKDNGPRHSYATYRSQVTKNTVQVADEMGNSPTKIEKHYRKKSVELATAEEWFAIMPPKLAENVLALDA